MSETNRRRQVDGQKHRAIIANALGACLWDRMVLQIIIDRKVCDGRSFSRNFAGFSRIFAAHRIREQVRACFFRLVESEQRTMSTHRQAFRCAGVPIAILDDVAGSAARLHWAPKPGNVSSDMTMSYSATTIRSTTVLLSFSAIIH